MEEVDAVSVTRLGSIGGAVNTGRALGRVTGNTIGCIFLNYSDSRHIMRPLQVTYRRRKVPIGSGRAVSSLNHTYHVGIQTATMNILHWS